MQVLGAGVVGGSVATLAIIGFFALNLTRDQQISFLGSAFGALVAALTAIVAIEFQMRRRERAGKRIVIELLDQAERAFRNYDRWLRGELSDQDTDGGKRPAIVMVRSIKEAMTVARELRSQVRGMAHATLLLEFTIPELSALESAASTSGEMRLGKHGPNAKHLIAEALFVRDHVLI